MNAFTTLKKEAFNFTSWIHVAVSVTTFISVLVIYIVFATAYLEGKRQMEKEWNGKKRKGIKQKWYRIWKDSPGKSVIK